MKSAIRLALGVAAVAVAGMVIYSIRRENTGRMLTQVADEGYETAHDILFPRKSKRGTNLKYGPVIPID
jgi:hypothetical protein